METYIVSFFCLWDKNVFLEKQSLQNMQWTTNNKKVPEAKWREYEGNTMKYRRIAWLESHFEGITEMNAL